MTGGGGDRTRSRGALPAGRLRPRGIAIPGLLAAAALASCSPPSWVSHPMPVPPDRSCRTGGGVGHDVYLWDCVDGLHVVVSKYCGGFVGCDDAVREAVPCGEETALERRLSHDLGEGCRPPPEGLRWVTSGHRGRKQGGGLPDAAPL